MPLETNGKTDESAADPEFGPWLAQASILVVDDEPGMRNFLVRVLGPRCKRIEEASDVKQASLKLDEQHFDVVVLDNILRRMADHHYKKTALMPSLHSWHPDLHHDRATTDGL